MLLGRFSPGQLHRALPGKCTQYLLSKLTILLVVTDEHNNKKTEDQQQQNFESTSMSDMGPRIISFNTLPIGYRCYQHTHSAEEFQ